MKIKIKTATTTVANYELKYYPMPEVNTKIQTWRYTQFRIWHGNDAFPLIFSVTGTSWTLGPGMEAMKWLMKNNMPQTNTNPVSLQQ